MNVRGSLPPFTGKALPTIPLAGLLKLATWTIVRKRNRLLILATAIGFLFALVTMFIASEKKLRSMYGDKALLRRTVRVHVANRLLTLEELVPLRRLPRVLDVAVEEQSMTLYDPEGRPLIANVMNAACSRLFDNYLHVEPRDLEVFARTQNAIILGRAIARRLSRQVGDEVVVDVEGHPLKLVVTSISDRGSDLDQTRIQTGQRPALTGGSQYIDQVYLLVADERDRPELARAVLARYAGTPMWDPTLTKLDALRYWMSRSALTLNVLRMTGMLALALTFGLTLTTVVLSLDERRRELATLCALGFRRSALVILIAAESMFLVAPGAFTGALGAYVWFFGRALPLQSLYPEVDPWAVAMTCALGVALGLAAAIAPAYRVMRMDVLSSMRCE